MDKVPLVLFADGVPDGSRDVREALGRREVRTAVVSSSRDLLELARREPPDVIVLDERLEALGSQILLSLLRRDCPGARIVLLLPEKSHPDRDALRAFEPLCVLVRPVSPQDFLAVLTSAIHAPEQPSRGKRPPVVFCVDDDAAFLRSLVRILRTRGYAAMAYDSPEEALEAIPVMRPDLAFIDVLMPGMSGLDLASEIRDDYGDDLPLVLLSARSSDREIAEGYRSGATRYITKPCEPETILGVAEQLLGQGPQTRTSVSPRS